MLKFEAVIFDLDGVITQTALVHGTAWKWMFDAYLKTREERYGEPFKEFTHAADYLPYVDGKPRYKGVASFLESRGIEIPFGDPSDDPELETACALGNRKNILFNEVLDKEGIKMYDSTVELIKQLKEQDVRIGVASSSKNCKPVLETCGLLDYFETRIDGVVSAEIGLNGKPEPDIFTTACDRLGVEYSKAIVVEDAVSGVQAGKKGNFGLVIGLAREDNIKELQINGADIVVEDMSELPLEEINEWFISGIEHDSWKLEYFDYDTSKEKSREALLSIGNGYFGTRGALEESVANKVNYPGTYVTGLFNRLSSKVGDRDVENEDFVNLPNWLPVSFRIEDGPWLKIEGESTMKVEKLYRCLDMKNGVLVKEMIVEDEEGRQTLVESLRFAGMHEAHVAGISYSIRPLNYSAEISVRSELNGKHINAGVERYASLSQEHLKPVNESFEEGLMLLEMATTQSEIEMATLGRNIFEAEGSVTVERELDEGMVAESFRVHAKEGELVSLEKLVCIYTSREKDSTEPAKDAIACMKNQGDFASVLASSAKAWNGIWEKMDIKVEGDRAAQRLLHLHSFHMLVSASEHFAKLEAGIGPRGVHGEAYRGHVFWDEVYMLPFYNLHYPEIAKATLLYRYHRLDAARAYAKEYGFEGAMFPWQSGSDGGEETQVVHLNPVSGEWGPDYSSLQRHVSLAIAYNVYQYFHVSEDAAFMGEYGAELYLDICKFWVSKSRFDEADGRYHIDKVMGPDEFHEHLPGSEEGGLTDNAYTNIMVSWMLEKAFAMMLDCDVRKLEEVLFKLGIDDAAIEQWKAIQKGLALNISKEGIIEQFRGYFDLDELDWDAYRKKYGDIHRLDRILKAEGKSPDEYKLSKQADLLMVFYFLGKEEVSRIVSGLGYAVPEDYLTKNFDYYIQRTSHGSTLSRLVHARLALQEGHFETGWELYRESLESDLNDIQGGTTGEGIHCGVMAGTLYDTLVSFAGLDLYGEKPVFNSSLPEAWKSLEFKFEFKGASYHVQAKKDKVKVLEL